MTENSRTTRLARNLVWVSDLCASSLSVWCQAYLIACVWNCYRYVTSRGSSEVLLYVTTNDTTVSRKNLKKKRNVNVILAPPPPHTCAGNHPEAGPKISSRFLFFQPSRENISSCLDSSENVFLQLKRAVANILAKIASHAASIKQRRDASRVQFTAEQIFCQHQQQRN